MISRRFEDCSKESRIECNRFKNISNVIIFQQMDPKKDVSTAILDQKKAPNKLMVHFC